MLSLRFPLSFGGFTFIMNTVFILIQIAIQRRNFPPVQLLQIAANVLFSAFLDVSMAALSWLHPAGWFARGGCMLLGCAILACGISIEIAPDVITVPGEGLRVGRLAIDTGELAIDGAFDALDYTEETVSGSGFWSRLFGG